MAWLHFFFANELIGLIGFRSFFCFNLFIVVFMVRHIAKSKKVNITIIINSINGYLLIGVLGAVLLSMTEIV